MDVFRLDSIAPSVSGRFRKASAAKRRHAALLACQHAATTVGLTSPEVGEALAALRGDGVAGPSLCQRLEEMVAEFDEQYLRLDDDGDPAHKDEALRLFSMARATSALVFALSIDDAQLHEAIYEAMAAMNDPDELTRMVDGALTCY